MQSVVLYVCETVIRLNDKNNEENTCIKCENKNKNDQNYIH